ncbi:MAG: UbiA family prenyltransferase [Candidatus Krumholzibacteria bacterium]|nr:UbiA family prenyltransferase [Candidatus Krumholzibacteria bacterium]
MDQAIKRAPAPGAGGAGPPSPRGGPAAGSGPRIPPPGSANALDYIFLLRPTILIPVWTFFLLGARHGRPAAGVSPDPVMLAAGLALFSALMGAVYVINQITDRATDLAANKLFLISHSIVSLPSARIMAALLAAASLAGGFLFMSGKFLIILSASLLLGLLYSVEPVRLKKRAVLDIAANAAGSGVLNTLAGWTAAGAPIEGYVVLLPYPLAVASVHMVTALADIEADRGSGLGTSGVLAGPGTGMRIAAGLMCAAAASALLVGNRPALFASLLSLPLLVAAASGMKEPAAGRILLPAKIATLVFALAAGFFFPLFIPLLAAVIIATRIYYKRRFGISYPSL